MHMDRIETLIDVIERAPNDAFSIRRFRTCVAGHAFASGLFPEMTHRADAAGFGRALGVPAIVLERIVSPYFYPDPDGLPAKSLAIEKLRTLMEVHAAEQPKQQPAKPATEVPRRLRFGRLLSPELIWRAGHFRLPSATQTREVEHAL